ncbi:hypothetical protein K456DRAFT_1758936 [Colletotrichum gloeosporioides 23]|nr:hypothetical protein K456DRAFT_1758936 [Colletotrichum gloeosporioides 23]
MASLLLGGAERRDDGRRAGRAHPRESVDWKGKKKVRLWVVLALFTSCRFWHGCSDVSREATSTASWRRGLRCIPCEGCAGTISGPALFDVVPNVQLRAIRQLSVKPSWRRSEGRGAAVPLFTSSLGSAQSFYPKERTVIDGASDEMRDVVPLACCCFWVRQDADPCPSVANRGRQETVQDRLIPSSSRRRCHCQSTMASRQRGE